MLRACGVAVGANSRVCGGTKFYGAGSVIIGEDCWIGLETKFHTAANVQICIGNCCDVAPEVMFICGSHEMGNPERRAGPGRSRSIKIGDGVWIGARSTVLGGAQIGDSSMCAAGALVPGKIYPPSAMLIGQPVSVRNFLPEDFE